MRLGTMVPYRGAFRAAGDGECEPSVLFVDYRTCEDKIRQCYKLSTHVQTVSRKKENLSLCAISMVADCNTVGYLICP